MIPEEVFSADFDITLMNAGNNHLPATSDNGNYQLELLFYIQFVDSESHFLFMDTNITHLIGRLGAGLQKEEELKFDDEQGDFSIPSEACKGEKHDLCVYLSVKETEYTAIFLERGSTRGWKCTPFYDLKCKGK